MGYEIDFLPVGEGGKSGDAIAIRYGNLFGSRQEQRVVVIDGGFQASGEALVRHIINFYHTDYVDLVISTHPDADHVAGLAYVLENLTVNELWMHCPWDHDSEVANYLGGRISNISRPKLQKSLDTARDLAVLAHRMGVPVREPFTGLSYDGGSLVVVSPSVDFYTELLPEFRGQPEAEAPSGGLVKQAVEVVRKIAEHFNFETLTDEGETSAENESSTILLFQQDGHSALFTADAGQRALARAIVKLVASGINPAGLNFVQVPHHGSQRNVGPTILNQLLGPRLPADQVLKVAFASSSADGAPKHPSKKVMNAFRRRGAPVHATLGVSKCHHNAAPNRGWAPSIALPLFNEVED